MPLFNESNRKVLKFFAKFLICIFFACGATFSGITAASADEYNIILENISAVPSGYTQLEYLEGTGSQWLCTDIHPSLTMVSQIGIKMSAYTGYVIYGFYNNKNTMYRLFNYNGSMYLDIDNDTTGRLTGNNMFQNNVYYDLEIGNRYVKNLSTNTTLISGDAFSNFSWNAQNYNMCLFSSSGTNTIGRGKIYYIKVYDNNILAYNYIPTKRNSDNVLGMYDTVTNTFKTNSGSGTFTAGPATNVQTYTYGVGTTIDSTDAGTRDGYTFAGWCTDSALTNCAMTQTIGTSDTGDKTFYAKWTAVAATEYNITYVMDGGTNYNNAPTTYMSGTGATIDGTPTKSGYTFAGWCTDSGLTSCNTTQTISSSDTGDKTFYAQWTPATYNITLNNIGDLPSGYTQLEYLQSTGGQYIDTGFTPNQDTRVITEYYVPSSSVDFSIGARQTGGIQNFSIVSTSSGVFRSDYNNDLNSFNNTPSSFFNARITVDKNKNVTNVYDTQGNILRTVTHSYANFTSPVSLVIFGMHQPNNYGTNASGGRLYYVTIYDNGTLVRNFIPAKRNSDNELGLYDTVSGTFFTNSGSGTFTAGPATNVQTYTYGVGTTIDSTTAGTRDGYTFAGWCTDSALTNCAMTQTIGTTATGDKTFYAKWVSGINCDTGYSLNAAGTACEPNSITVNWGDGESESCSYGEELTVPATPPTRRGYTFVGWTFE